VLFAAALACAARADADPIETSFAITINPLDGEHAVTNGGVDRINFAPLPLGELVVRSGHESIRIEGLPPVALRYGGSGSGASDTSLSLINATYRHSFAGGWFVGAGQTLYNQSTTYSFSDYTFVYARGPLVLPIYGREKQYSRVTGPRIEIGNISRLRSATLEVSVAANIRMHGVQYTFIPYTSFYARPANETFADPENAGQIDVSARIAHRISRHGELLYGFRYLNFTSHYDDFPGQLADRDVGFAPVIGYRVKL
jgi:hypothetical protein